MPALDLQRHGFSGFQINAGLRFIYGRRRLYDRPDPQRHTVGNSAVNPAVVIGQGFDAALLDRNVIVRFAAFFHCKIKPIAEFHTLDSPDAEK